MYRGPRGKSNTTLTGTTALYKFLVLSLDLSFSGGKQNFRKIDIMAVLLNLRPIY